MSTSSDATPPGIEVRRRPVQARSRQRFDAILDAAGALIARRGLGPVSMTEIAEEAGTTVSAVYRYFPGKQSIVRELALLTFADDAELTRGFAADDTLPIEERIVIAVRAYCDRCRRDPVRLQVRAAIHADAELTALDLADSRRNAAVLAQALARSGPDVPYRELERRTLIFVELVYPFIQLTTRVGAAEADALVEEFALSVQAMLLRPPGR